MNTSLFANLKLVLPHSITPLKSDNFDWSLEAKGPKCRVFSYIGLEGYIKWDEILDISARFTWSWALFPFWVLLFGRVAPVDVSTGAARICAVVWGRARFPWTRISWQLWSWPFPKCTIQIGFHCSLQGHRGSRRQTPEGATIGVKLFTLFTLEKMNLLFSGFWNQGITALEVCVTSQNSFKGFMAVALQQLQNLPQVQRT